MGVQKNIFNEAVLFSTQSIYWNLCVRKKDKFTLKNVAEVDLWNFQILISSNINLMTLVEGAH